jgi:hypothetical protein
LNIPCAAPILFECIFGTSCGGLQATAKAEGVTESSDIADVGQIPIECRHDLFLRAISLALWSRSRSKADQGADSLQRLGWDDRAAGVIEA